MPAPATMVIMLIEQIRSDLNDATRARDAATQLTLRSLIAAIQEAQVAGDQAIKLNDDGILTVLKAQAKRRVDAAEAFEAGGAHERGATERAEKVIIEKYLPTALSESDVAAIVDRVMADNGFAKQSDMGKAMKAVNAEVAGRADGRIVADMVKSRLA
jgi:uncharacterized protein